MTGMAGKIVNVTALVPGVGFALVAVTVALKVPVDVGVPVITPVPAITLSPGGKPVALKLVGEFVAVMVYPEPNGAPIVPLAAAALVITGEAGMIVKVTPRVPAMGLAFDAVTVALNVPPEVGVPEITPVDVLMLKPGGNPEAPNEVGLLLAVTV
jgi:hypothetical protein